FCLHFPSSTHSHLSPLSLHDALPISYQLSIVVNKWNGDDKINFSHANPRRLSAEQLLDAVTVATGSQPKFIGMPKEMRAVEIPEDRKSTRLNSSHEWISYAVFCLKKK